MSIRLMVAPLGKVSQRNKEALLNASRSVWRTTHGAHDLSNSLGPPVDGPKARAASKQVALCCQVLEVACSKDSMLVHIF